MAASKTTSLIAQLRYFMHVINHAISILVQRFGFLPIFSFPSLLPSYNLFRSIVKYRLLHIFETLTSENRRIENFCTVSRHCRFPTMMLNAKMGFRLDSEKHSFALYPSFFHANYYRKISSFLNFKRQ